LYRDFRDFRPNVVLTSELGMRSLIAFLYGWWYSVPVIPWVCATGHTERHNSYFREQFRKLLLRNAPCVCTNLTEASEYLTQKLNVTADKLFHTPYVVDVLRYQAKVGKARSSRRKVRSTLGLSGMVFLYVGQIIKRKGISQLIDAISALSDRVLQKASFLFVGGTIPPSVHQQLKSRAVRYAVVDFVQPNNLPKYYAAADVFVFPTLEDEWGIVLNEAAAAGLPILGSIYAGATRDLVKEGKNGFRFDPLDTPSLTRLLDKVVTLPHGDLFTLGRMSLKIARRLDLSFTAKNLDAALAYSVASSVRK